MNENVSPTAAAEAPLQRFGFEFRGNAKEYFGVWIVNLLLSIVTLGIYTAWAKVRRLRYFYGNTYLDGHNFEYHARPVQILIGRIIVVVVLLIYSGLNALNPLFALLLIPYFFALPWLINKAMAFNARMTSYRNVRLSFRGSYWRAFGIFVLLPFAAIFTLGILIPYVSRASANYIGNGMKFGTAQFASDAPLRKFYGNLGMSVVFMLIMGVVLAIPGYGAGLIAALSNPGAVVEMGASPTIFAIFVGLAVGLYLALFLALLFYAAGSRNIAFNATTLDGKHHFVSTLGRGRYVWILVSNLFAAILTIGLLRPWAAVRTWRFFANNTAVETAGSLDGFIDEAAPSGEVAAAEFFDIEGIDFGL